MLAHQHDRGAATYKRITPIAPAPFQFSICRTARRRRRPMQVGEKDQPLICWTTSLATAVEFCSAGLVPVRLHVERSVGWHAVTVNVPVTASGPLQQQLAGSVASQPKHRCVASPIVPFIFSPQNLTNVVSLLSGACMAAGPSFVADVDKPGVPYFVCGSAGCKRLSMLPTGLMSGQVARLGRMYAWLQHVPSSAAGCSVAPGFEPTRQLVGVVHQHIMC
jgi:hypothetical protein